MSTYTARRPVRKRRDFVPIFLLLFSLVSMPVLGYVGWMVLKRKPRPQPAPAPVTTVQVVHADDNPGTKFPVGQAADRTPRDDAPYGSTSGSNNSRQKTRDRAAQMGGGHHDSSAALDQIAENLNEALSLPKKIAVVWLFDETGSASQLREDVISQLPQMYRKFDTGAAKPADDKAAGDDSPVLTFVAQFGPKVKFLTEQPVATLDEVEAAVGKLHEGPGHIENTFAAIQAAAERVVDYRKKKGRYVTIIVVTDEVGDDRAKIDEVLPKLTPYGIPVQVIGPTALFGRAEADGGHQAADGTPPAGQVWVVQGPDAHDPDAIKLDFPTGGHDFDVDTGLGPYALARLCKETDGQYFTVSHGRGGDSGLKGFEPQYMSEQAYEQQLQNNKAKRALVEAAKLPRAAVQSHMTSSFNNDDDVKRNLSAEAAQKPIAKVMPGIDALYNALKPGESDLPKLAGSNDKRWRAAYELALGRAGAAKVRHQGYIEMTAQMKSGRKIENPDHHTWVLEQTDDPMGISVLDKLAAKSREYLKDVIKQYPNTPWAKAAEQELQTPLSYKWVDR